VSALILLLSLAGCSSNSTHKITVAPFASDGAWTWFQGPGAVYIKGEKERTYSGWVTREGNLELGFFDHESGEKDFVILRKNWNANDNNSLAFLVLPDKRIMVFYAQHHGQKLFARTSIKPESIESWGDEVVVADTGKITFSHPVYLSDEGRYYVFWRGSTMKPTFATSEDGIHWGRPKMLLVEEGREGIDPRPYLKVVSDGKSSIHFSFTNGHPKTEPANSIYYLKYEAGKFYKADGSVAGSIDALPVKYGDSDLVYDAKKTGVRSWIWDIALDGALNPVIAYTRIPEKTDHRYHYAKWSGMNWEDFEITAAGSWFPNTKPGEVEKEPYYSGGIVIDGSQTDTVYLSRQVDDVFEIEKWQRPDGAGSKWSGVPVTHNSEKNNVRPVVAKKFGCKHLGCFKSPVIWMKGDYFFYKDFSTSVRMAY